MNLAGVLRVFELEQELERTRAPRGGDGASRRGGAGRALGRDRTGPAVLPGRARALRGRGQRGRPGPGRPPAPRSRCGSRAPPTTDRRRPAPDAAARGRPRALARHPPILRLVPDRRPMLSGMGDDQDISRRTLLAGAALVPVALAVTACGSGEDDGVASGRRRALERIRDAGRDARLPRRGRARARPIDGPYFTPGSPLRASLAHRRLAGTRLVITGRVRLDRLPAAGPCAAWTSARRRARDLRQPRLSAARAPVHRRPPLRAWRTVRARPLPRPHPSHPRQGPAARRPRPDDRSLPG